MDAFSIGDDTPEAMLDALRDAPAAGEAAREAQLSRIVERFPAERLREAVRGRLRMLGGVDGEAILRLVEAYANPALLEELAEALEDQPDLAPERAWEALSLIEGAGLLDDYPALLERWEELGETLDSEDDALETLVGQLEEESEGSWVALQGLGAVEPEVRAEILEGLGRSPTGPGLVSFLRFLSFAHDQTTRLAALDALASDANDDDLTRRMAWASIAHDHPDAEVRDRARRHLGPEADEVIARVLQGREADRPRVIRTLVTALDGAGRGSIAVASVRRGERVVVTFLCDVMRGVVDVVGQVHDDPAVVSTLFEEFEADADLCVVADAPGLAEGLLAGSLLLCGPETNPVLRFWVEQALGPDFRAEPFGGLVRDDDLAAHALESMDEAIGSILDACPDWVDASDLTYDIAEEIALRPGAGPPDPRRDAGAYRYLFEHRLLGRLEPYRRMLFWMASFWEASGEPRLARSALALAWQLSDSQHEVPGHPFLVALTTRSLQAAQDDIRSGLDPRAR